MAIYLQPDEVLNWDGLTVNKYFLTEHNVNKINLPLKMTKNLKGITVHNTDWINVKVETTPAEQYTRATVNGNMKDVRVHFYVDDKCAWWILPNDQEGWHARDGRGDGNTATLAIECIMKSVDDEASLKSRSNCAKLVAYLLKKYSMTTYNVYSHTYWLNVAAGKGKELTKDGRCVLPNSYKNCPIYILPKWIDFLNEINLYMGKQPNATASTKVEEKGGKDKLCGKASGTYKVSDNTKFYTDGSKNVITKFNYEKHQDYYLSPHFQVKEFVSKDAKTLYSNDVKIHNRLIELLEALYEKLDCGAIIVTCGYRTDVHSIAVGGYAGDMHTKGQAADIVCRDKSGNLIPAQKVCCALEDMGNVYGIGFISNRAVHVDTRGKDRKWWGDETKYGCPNINKLGYTSFHKYFGV